MSSTILPVRIHRQLPSSGPRISVGEYHRLIEEGALREDDRVELLDGWIIAKMTHKPLHDGIIQIVSKRLAQFLPPGWEIRIQSAITTADSEPEPDIVVARGHERTYLTRHPGPTDISLLVEVAESSLDQDRTIKSAIYARAGIAVYWIINLIDFQIEVSTDPSAPGADSMYHSRHIYRGEEKLPVLIEGVEVAQVLARELLP
jgi:Uma2 family endonuclease